jgi:hypothetical protein
LNGVVLAPEGLAIFASAGFGTPAPGEMQAFSLFLRSQSFSFSIHSGHTNQGQRDHA